MRLLLVFAVLGLAGCFGDCPYQVWSIDGRATSEARFDLANASVAEQALEGMGFDAVRDGLSVRGENGDLAVHVTLDEGKTSVFVTTALDRREFRSYEAARRYVDEHMADAEARINATLADLESRIGWPAFVHHAVEGPIVVC